MHVRPASEADKEALGAVLAASYGTLMRGAYDDALLARALPRIGRPNHRLLASGHYHIAETESGEAVGCGGWSATAPGRRGRRPGIAHVRHFAVHPDWTGRGVGRAIFERCEAEARTAGFTRWICYASLNGEAFYRALGFRRLRRIDVAMGADLRFPSILMVREIRP